MATEIEHKFLLKNDSWGQFVFKTAEMKQGYILNCPEKVVRIRVTPAKSFITIKGKSIGISRTEYEYPIDEFDALAMIETLCENVIEKTRYYVEYEDNVWEIDVFRGDNEGLVLAELEVKSECEEFPIPPWLGKNVSDDPRYYNSSLALKPFKEFDD